MSRFDRIYRIHDKLKTARHPVPMRVFTEELEATRNTITRDFEFLRDSLGAPLEYCREANGHHYSPDAPEFELPGFWMSPAELYALLACEQLLEKVQPGILANRLAPLKNKVRRLLGESGHDAEVVSQRVQIKTTQTRVADHRIFDPVAAATLSQNTLRFGYQSRSAAGSKSRTVDPQRLLNYRSNWYLLGHCHQANDLRLFSLDRISAPESGGETGVQVSNQRLDEFTSSAFGIFGGQPKATAELKFSTHAAEWVADELWHSDQVGRWGDDGYYLSVPYSDEREIAMEILRHGAEVEVIHPLELRAEIITRIQRMARNY